MKPVIKLIFHNSAQAIMQAHTEGVVQRIREVEGIKVDPTEIEFDNGKFTFKLNSEMVIDHINDNGFWAFADTWTNTIHFYFDERIGLKTRFRVLAHEFAHLTGKPCKSPMKEEQRCDAFAEQAQQLMVLWEQLKLLEKSNQNPA